MTETRPKGPVVIEYDAEERAPTITPSSAPPVPDPEDPPQGRAMVAATRAVATRMSMVGRLFWAAIIALLTLWISTAAWDFVFGLFARNTWLGWGATAVIGLVLLTLLIMAGREVAALGRLGRIDRVRSGAEAARSDADLKGARATVSSLKTLYSGRDDLSWGLGNLKDAEGDALDAGAPEHDLMAPLDKAVEAEIQAAARQVATVTAIVPLTLADVVVALTSNLRMIRRIAEIYGGRSGRLGSWRLMRAVATHLVATGAVGVADDMIGSIAGGGALARISRRFGEGIINGALTARVGVAAMEVCRPLPFHALEKPGVTATVRRALQGFFSKES